MGHGSLRTLGWAGRIVVPVAAAAVLLTACGSSSGGAGGAAAGQSSPGSSTAAAVAMIEAHTGPMGAYLTDGTGRALYDFVSDTPTSSSCSGQCVQFWPPLTTTGAPTVSGSAKASLLGTLTRPDGTLQVTYDGHPLYYFKEDTSAGDTKGQGMNVFGAKWWLVNSAGSSITSGASSPKTSPSMPPTSKPSSHTSSSSSSSGAGGGWA